MIIWTCAYTEPRKEFQTQGEIKRFGFETFLPVMTRAKMIRRKRMILTEAIFSRYIFVAMPMITFSEAYSKIRRARGVLHLLEGPKGPSAVPGEVIEKFRHAERHGCFDYSRPKSEFAKGENVQILDGPFAGLIAKVQSASPRKRIRILLKLLGSEIETEIATEDLQKVG